MERCSRWAPARGLPEAGEPVRRCVYRQPLHEFPSHPPGIRQEGNLYAKGHGFQITLTPDKAAALRDSGTRCSPRHPPGRMLLGPPGADGSQLRATVEIVEAVGSDIYLDLSIAGASITARVQPTVRVEVGQQVNFHPDPEQIHLFDRETGISLL